MLALLLILGIGGCVALIGQLETEPRDQARAFVDLLSNSDYEGARGLTDSQCGSDVAVAALEAADIGMFVTGHDLDDVSLGEIEGDGRSGAEVTGTISGNLPEGGSTSADARFIMVDTDDGWRVCTFEFPELLG